MLTISFFISYTNPKCIKEGVRKKNSNQLFRQPSCEFFCGGGAAAAETDYKWLEVEAGLEEEFEEDSFEDIQVEDKHHLHCILVSDNLDIWFTWNHTYIYM